VGLAILSAHMGPERGTLAYFPPEGPHDQTADLYALGKTLYQLLTGAGLERFQEFADGTLAIPGGDPRGRRLRQIILRACHPDAKQRFDSAAAMLRSLDEAFGVRRRTYRIAAGLFVLFLLLVGTSLALWKALSPDTEGIGPGFTLEEEEEFKRGQKDLRNLKNAGKFAEAIKLQEKLLEISTRALGPKHDSTLAAQMDLDTSRRINNLPRKAQDEVANVFRMTENIPNLFDQGYVTEALADQRTALEVLQKHIEEDDQEVARTMLFLGFLLRASKDYDESEKWSKKSLEMLLRLWGGREYWDSTTARNNLAGCRFAKGRYDLAEEDYRKVLDIRLKMKRPPGHDLTIISRINLAKTLRKLGKNDEADDGFRQAGVESARLSDDDGSKASICISLADDCEGEKKMRPAQRYLEAALQSALRVQKEESVAAAGVRLRLAANLVAQGKPEEAKEHVIKAMWFIMPRVPPLNATAGSMGSPMPCLGTLAVLARKPPAGAP
jgi:tetratricopeptide (TPR) repeat protein